jgi:CheY-like chemotaxis protein
VSAAPLILVAEDNELMVELLHTMLSSWGYAFEVVGDGGRVMRLMEDQAFDLIIMDILIPGMNGIDTARCIRDMPEPKRSTPIIALTGGMVTTTMAELDAAHFAAILQKPVMPDQLRAAIETALRTRGL